MPGSPDGAVAERRAENGIGVAASYKQTVPGQGLGRGCGHHHEPHRLCRRKWGLPAQKGPARQRHRAMQQSCRPSAKRRTDGRPDRDRHCPFATAKHRAGLHRPHHVRRAGRRNSGRAGGTRRRSARGGPLVKRLQRGAGHKSPLGRRLHLRPPRDAQRIRRVSQ